MLHSRIKDIVVKTSLEGNATDTLAPGDRVAGLIHISVLNDVRIKTLAVSSIGFEIVYGKRDISVSHPIRSMASIAHIPATVKDVKIFYARRTVVLEDSVLPCGSHTYSFRTRLPVVGLEPSLDTGLVGIHYGITTMVTLPNGENVSSQCGFRVGNITPMNRRITANECIKHGMRVKTKAEILNRRDLNVTILTERENNNNNNHNINRLGNVSRPKKAKTKFKRITAIGQDVTNGVEEETISSALIPLRPNVENTAILKMALDGYRLVPSIRPEVAHLFSINYNLKCRIQFERHRIKRPSSITMLIPVDVPDEARTTYMNGILGPDGIPIITQVAETSIVRDVGKQLGLGPEDMGVDGEGEYGGIGANADNQDDEDLYNNLFD